jgi:16S rRNA (uracil1498-N3)-methyltransferase
MSPPRFFLEALPTSGHARLSPDDARHAQSVLRLKVGDQVQLFDGQGLEADALIESVAKAAVHVTITSAKTVSRESISKLELVVALPKGDRQKQLIDMLVQLGVHQLTPLQCDRAVAQPTENALERLQRSVVEASKQCGRNHLMVISQPTSVASLSGNTQVLQANASHENALNLFAHPYGSAIPLMEQLFVKKTPAASSDENTRLRHGRVIIGPEGGLTDAECQLLRENGWQQIHLGKRILRIETAAVMVASTWATLEEVSVKPELKSV